jgi:hypothetical protein
MTQSNKTRFISLCIFNITHVIHCIVFEITAFSFFNTIIFFNFFRCLITSDLQCSRRKYHLHEIIFNVSHDWIEFINSISMFNIWLNSRVDKSKCFLTSQIFWSVFLSIKVSMNMSQKKLLFFNLLIEIKITFEFDMYAMFSNNNFLN